MSTIGTPTYKLAIYLLQFFIPLTQNEYTVTDSFHFAQENICIDNVYKDDENSSKIPKDVFCNLVTVVTSESFFMFSSKFYKQIDGVAMGSPLGPALANIFMCSFENKWLKDCPHSLKPVFYRRYVDDIFVLFSSLDQAEKFKKYLSSKYPNIKFSLEKENDGRLSFLDINIFREKGKFVTNVYRKKTFSGVYTNFNSFIPETYKTGLIESLLFRCFNLCSDFVKFNDEINIFKSILYKNSNPRDLVDKKFLDRVSTQKVVVSTVPKMDLMIVLPYLGKFSLQIPTRINRVMKNKLPQKINLQVDQFLHIHRLLFISAVAAMLPIMAKLSAILKSECVNILDFLLLLERE